jgi:outer membrane protein OmpA-like peptidoglycan-associated protein/tetratricopeptide (TPR) repeat protein
MNIRHVYCLVFFLLGTAGGRLSAQTLQFRLADDAMKNLDYSSAIAWYHQALAASDDPVAKLNLAECYRKINDTKDAEYWYRQIVELPGTKPIYHLYYGMMLQANDHCEVARIWFQKYIKENPDDARGQFLAKACDYRDELNNKNKGVYTIANMKRFNSNKNDYSPAICGNQLVFASDREHTELLKRTNMWTGSPFSELYAVSMEQSGAQPEEFLYSNPGKFSKGLNSKFNDAVVSFTPDLKKVYFTRNSITSGKTGRSEDGLVKLKIYSATRDESGEWTNIVPLPFNSDEYNTAHPSISADGMRLYFSSNMPGGYGGMDLYVSEWSDSHWSAPVNLGTSVNTEGDEMFPFLAADNRLYFASNGLIGLGGLDIFYTSCKGKTDQWNLPVNLGAPINSTHDDFGIAFGGDLTWGYFSSDRADGVGGDDIYGFKKYASPVEITIVDAQTNLPVSGVAVTNSKNNLTMLTGSDGKIGFDMRFQECADFTTARKNYESTSKKVCPDTTRPAGEVTRIEIPIRKQANFYIQGIAFDMADGLPAEGASIMLMNECNKPLPEALVTGADGKFKLKLDRDCCYKVRAALDGYFAVESDPICTKGLTANNTFRISLNLEPFRDEDGFTSAKPARDDGSPKLNMKTGVYENKDGSPGSFDFGGDVVVKNGVLLDNGNPSKPEKRDWVRSKDGFLIDLYYDFNQNKVSENSMGELEHLLRTLQANPELSIEIASHTDSRGSDDYNLQLSQQRAEGVVDWLVQRGIARSRLTAHGYGETQPVNHCINDVPCSEAEHQMNRRTEFRVMGKNGAPLSKPKQAVRG